MGTAVEATSSAASVCTSLSPREERQQLHEMVQRHECVEGLPEALKLCGAYFNENKVLEHTCTTAAQLAAGEIRTTAAAANASVPIGATVARLASDLPKPSKQARAEAVVPDSISEEAPAPGSAQRKGQFDSQDADQAP